jgi:hypothetical protein
MFATVCGIWHEQNRFFRHTGRQDAWTSRLSARFGLGGRGAPRLENGNALLAWDISFLMGPLRGWNGPQSARARERNVGT